jgi:hypothetical protein
MKIFEHVFTASARLAGLGIENTSRRKDFLSPRAQPADIGSRPTAEINLVAATSWRQK